ncbi:hypothetical protein EK21DRAFT_84791 [Setomelanomma holmii]|uniref:Heterokaryon incompatibility domain-containing protein n=1 Tax=Setomelanomma holmii TaxID=210430 RepID=A0A9P4HKG5_9PLEO|nr:hypothetical protein EK21DRAFT_84791 [Setomelanomma holmii]
MAARRNLTQHREAVRQLNGGIDGNELCIPCKKAVFDDDFDRIGTKAWPNDGYPECEHLDKPKLYCCFCRHILRAKELAKRRGQHHDASQKAELGWVMIGMEQGIFVHDDGVDLDDADAKELEDFEVESCSFVRSVTHRWVDMRRIKNWLDQCENQHGELCNSHRNTANIAFGSLILVDVVDNLLSKQFLTLQANYEGLLVPGSRSSQPITQTIKDAMAFVKDLGGRYLWVDTVVSATNDSARMSSGLAKLLNCIVQDDLTNKATAIDQMAAIYSSAVATIIAMSGSSADTGLPGVHPTLRNENTVYIAPGLRIAERTPLERAMNEYTYGTEEYEDDYSTSAVFTLGKARSWSANNKARSKSYSKWDEFRWYEEVVPEYTAKRMGFPSDIVNAFTGVQTELGKMFDWKFVEESRTHLIRWSWAGWIGRVWYKDMVRPLHLSIGDLFKPIATFDMTTPSTLWLDCESIRLGQFTLQRSENRLENPHYNAQTTPDAYFMFDDQRRRCGLLFGDIESLTSNSASAPLELLRLFCWSRTNAMYCYGPVIAHSNDGNTQEEDLFHNEFEDVEWCTYNVMLVHWWGARYHRVVIGQMHRDTWKRAGPLRKTIAVQ